VALSLARVTREESIGDPMAGSLVEEVLTIWLQLAGPEGGALGSGTQVVDMDLCSLGLNLSLASFCIINFGGLVFLTTPSSSSSDDGSGLVTFLWADKSGDDAKELVFEEKFPMGFQDKGVESRVELDWEVIRLPCDNSSRREEMSDKPRELFSILPEDWEDIREPAEKLENVEVMGRSILVKFELLEKRLLLDSGASREGLSLSIWRVNMVSWRSFGSKGGAGAVIWAAGQLL
jgi:hypothetical protein